MVFMQARRLATTKKIIGLVSPNADEAEDLLYSWGDKRDIDVETYEVGTDIDVDDKDKTLGITIGGDGTFLEGIKEFSPQEVPVVGINAGRLAFLARIDSNDIEEALDEVLSGRARIDRRERIQVKGPLDGTGLNDVIVQNVPPEDPVERKIADLRVFVDGEYVGEYEGNGVVVSTPTGSTGLALSAGGPIHYPKDNSTLQITPLNVHRLGVRPIVVDKNAEIVIQPEDECQVLVDGGRYHTQIGRGDTLEISGSPTPGFLVKTSYDESFFSTTELLGWSIRDGERPSPVKTTVEEGMEERAVRVAKEAAQSTGKPLRELRGEAEVTRKSSASDVVTEADYISNEIITTAIENEFPEHNIMSEEEVMQDKDSRYTWLIDPLDGTGNFANGNPNYSVSIALLEENKPLAACIYVPETDDVYTAMKERGAYKNGDSKLSVSDRDNLEESVLISGYDPDGQYLTHFYQKTRAIRRLGSAALHLCYLASGSADAVWEYDTYPWDTAAGVLIAKEAGAKITNLDGNEYDPMKQDQRNELAGSNRSLHNIYLEEINQIENY